MMWRHAVAIWTFSGLLAVAQPGPPAGGPTAVVVDPLGKTLVTVQEHVPPPPVIRKAEAIPAALPTAWPAPTEVPQINPQTVKAPRPGTPDVRPPEVEREAQIDSASKWGTIPAPHQQPMQERPPWLSRHGTDLLIFTSGAFLLPAHRSGRRAIFALQAVICGIYHYCDQHRIGTDLSGPSCSEPSYRFWHLADHGMAYFVMLQMGFLLLGPEDPILRRLSPWSWQRHESRSMNETCRESGSLTGILCQLQTVAATRLCPGLVLLLVIWRTARGDHAIGSPAFHLLLGALCCILFIFAQSTFWLLRPTAAAQALQMKQSWLRVLLCLCSVVLASMMFVGMQLVANDRTKVGMGGAKALAHSAWHVGIAGLATVVFEIIGVEHVRMDMDHFQGHHFKDVVSGNMG